MPWLSRRSQHFSTISRNTAADKTKRDLVAISISISSLLISAVSAYFANFRLYDDLRVSLSSFPSKMVIVDNQLELGNGFGFIFFNSGNRPAAVLNASIDLKREDYAQATEPRKPDTGNACPEVLSDKIWRVARIDFKIQEPIVIKPGDIQPKSIILDTTSSDLVKTTGDKYKFLLYSSDKEKLYVRVCLHIVVATPGHSTMETGVRLYDVEGVVNDAIGYASFLRTPPNAPIVVAHTNGIIFQKN